VPGNEPVTDQCEPVTNESAIAVPEVDPVAAANPQFTAAELAFFRSVARG
jgi:hypothetical protein